MLQVVAEVILIRAQGGISHKTAAEEKTDICSVLDCSHTAGCEVICLDVIKMILVVMFIVKYSIKSTD